MRDRRIDAGIVTAAMSTTVVVASRRAAIDGQHVLVIALFMRRSRLSSLLERCMAKRLINKLHALKLNKTYTN